MVYEYFTSGNIVTNPTRTIVSQVKPNTTYEITLSDLKHMKDSSTVSGLSDIMTNKTINGVTSYTVTTPADNIESVIDLVRKTDNSVDVYVHSLNSPNYANFNYSGILKIYSNSALSSTVGSSVTVHNGSTGILTLPPGGSMLTNSYYFASEFTNITLNLPVYTDATRTPLQQNQIFDIRGLAYFRDSLYTTLIGGTHFSSGIGTPTFTIDKLDLPADRPIETGKWYAEAITADGNRIAIAYKVDGFTEVDLVIFQRSNSAYRGIFNLQNVITSNTGLTYGFRYDLVTDTEILLLAMSGDGSRCVVSNGDALVSVEITGTGIEVPSTITKPSMYTNHIHALSLSLDGNTLLISGSANGHASGHAHVSKHDGSAWSTFSDLSSSKITPNPNCAYGTVSTISGDGQTVLVVGGDISSIDSGGYVWKFNGSSWIYTYHLLLYFDKRYATCRLSYYGDEATIASQYGTNEKYMVYTENEDYTWNLLESNNNVNWLDRIKMIKLNSTHITFDGNRVNFSVSNLERMGLSFDQSVTYARSLKASNSELLYIIEGGKTNTIDSIFDYMNLRSPLYFTYNNMPYPSWTASPSTHKDVTGLSAHSGHWDAMSLSNDGNFILVGIPSSSRVRIYNVRNNTSFDIPGGTGFGNRCSMDDRARYIVVSDNSTTVRVYERTDDTSVLRRSLTRSNTGTPWNLKMSKKGNVIIMLESNNATVIRRWTSNTGDWSTASEDSNDLNQDSNMTVGIFSIDLNYDGSIIVASGRNGSDLSQVWLHDSSQGYNNVIGLAPHVWTLDAGQSVAISAYPNETTNKYLIVAGMPRSYLHNDKWGLANMWLMTYDNVNSVFYDIYEASSQKFSLQNYIDSTRYGRSVSVDARGRWVVLSGSNEDVTDPDKGGAVIVDVQNGHFVTGGYVFTSAYYKSIGYLSGLTHTTGGYDGYGHHGYGIQCKISSSGTVVAVSGDTLVKSFKTTSFGV